MTTHTADRRGLLAAAVLAAGLLWLAAAGGGIFAWAPCVAAVVFSAAWWLNGRPRGTEGRLTRVEVAGLAILAFSLLTLLPLPARVSALPKTERLAQNRLVQTTLREAAAAGLPGTPSAAVFALTRNRVGTMRLAVLVTAAFAAAMLAAGLGPRARRGHLRFLAVLGAATAVLGYIGQWRIPQGDTLWWFIRIPHALPGPVAGFVNRNHYAGFLALLCPAACALLADDLTRRRWLGAAAAAACLAAMTVALAVALSRGALIAFAAGMTATVIGLLLVRRALLALVLAVSLALLVAGLLARADPGVRARMRTLADLGATESFQHRVGMARDALRAWRAYPIIGAGGNAFRAVYPQFRTTSEREYSVHAANAYVQLLVEGGCAGALLFGLLGAVLWRDMRRAAAAPDNPPDRLFRLAAAGAAAAAGAHALGECALHLPLYAVTLASIVGLALRPPPAAGAAGARRGGPALICLACLALLTPAWRDMQRLDAPDELWVANARDVARALIGAPTSWQAWYEFGRRVAALERPGAGRLAEACVSRATECDPNNYRLWLAAGHYRLASKDYAGARRAFARARQLRSWVEVPFVPEK